jgi:hypothetical protein
MATSRRETILAYLLAQLETVPGITAARSRLVPARRENGIVAVLAPLEEVATPGVGSYYERRLTFTISVLAQGLIPDQAADAAATAIYAKLMATNATRTLGGLAEEPLAELGRVFLMEDGDGGHIDHQIRFAVTYWAALNDEATAG